MKGVYLLENLHISGKLSWLKHLDLHHRLRFANKDLIVLEKTYQSEDVGVQFAVDGALGVEVPVLVEGLVFTGEEEPERTIGREEARDCGHCFAKVA